MASTLRLAASVLVVVALVLIGTTAGIAANGNGNGNSNGQANGNSNSNSNANGNSTADGSSNSNANGNGSENGNGQGSGNATVTVCHKPTEDASTIEVNDNAVPAHLAHGDHLGACARPPVDEDEGGSQEEQGTTEEQDGNSTFQSVSSGSTASPSETRSLYCSTRGPVDRGNGEGLGIALNLPESQGAFLVEKGLATPAFFYEGIGVSCDHLPGFVYSGLWVDHVGDVVEGISVYPYYVPAS